MLTLIREKTQGIIATAILGAIALTFVAWGAGSYFDNSAANRVVAKVDGLEIDVLEYTEALQMYGRQTGAMPTSAVKQQIVNNLISESLLVKYAHDKGYRFTNQQLNNFIQNYPTFQQDGKFVRSLYDDFLRSQGQTAAGFESRIRNRALISQLYAGYTESAIITDADKKALLQLLNQKRRFSYITINTNDFAKKIKPNDADIKQYYTDNNKAFMTAEKVRIDYIELKTEDFVKGYNPTEEELRSIYENESGRYVTPAKHRIANILIEVAAGKDPAADQKAIDKINGLKKQIDQGANFAKLAKKHSDDKISAAQGGDLGFIQPDNLGDEALARAIAQLKTGEISAPVRSQYGYHLLKLTEFKPETRKPYENVIEELRQIARARVAYQRFSEAGTQLETLAYEHPDTLNAAADQLDLTVKHSQWFTQTEGAGIAEQQKIRAAAFGPEVLEEKRNSAPVELKEGHWVVLRLAEREKQNVKPLKEVRAQIEEAIKQKQAAEQAQALGEKILEQLENGADFAALAKEHQLVLRTPPAMARDNHPGVEQNIINQVFATPNPVDDKPIFNQAPLRNGIAVIALHEVQTGQAVPSAETTAQIEKLLAQRRGADYFSYISLGLRESAEVEIFDDRL